MSDHYTAAELLRISVERGRRHVWEREETAPPGVVLPPPVKQCDDSFAEVVIKARIRTIKRTFPLFKVPPDVISHIASAIPTNIGDLRKATNLFLAHWVLSGGVLSSDTAERVVRGVAPIEPVKKIKIDQIVKAVAEHFDVSAVDLLSMRHMTKEILRPRQVAMYLCKKLTLRSFPEIGRIFGGRGHHMVSHAVRAVDDILNGTKTTRRPCSRPQPGDATLAADIAALKERLEA